MSEGVPIVHETLAARVAEALASLPGAGPVTCACEDARACWAETGRFDVIYLDAMFAPHPTSAAPAKRMRALARLAPATTDAELAELLETARGVASSRVVVKRRRHAPALPGSQPGWAVRGRSVRFDVYPPLATKPSTA